MKFGLLPLILLAPLQAWAEDRYHVQFSESLDRVTVEACFEGKAPRSMYRNEKANEILIEMQAAGNPIQPGSRYGRFNLPAMPDDSCVEWTVDLAAATKADRRTAADFEHGILTDGDLWFWRDRDQRAIRVTIDIPEGMSLSAPWPQAESGTGKSFFPEPTPAQWSSRIAVGRFPVQEIEIGGARLHMAAIGELTAAQRSMFARWIAESARAVVDVVGEFPRNDVQVLVVPIGPRSGPVPWAHVVRGGGPAIEFFVDETRSFETFSDDWTATHEFSHLLTPLISRRDRWLSEGMASYYQNVLRARDGRLTEQQAWQRLLAGFERGRKATRPGQSLAEATRSGWNSTMRVYWSGAAMMLMADARLRSVSDQRQSLDTALARFHDCCFDVNRSWRAREFLSELDRLTGHDVFTSLYRQHVDDNAFPDVEDTLRDLGVDNRGSRVTLVPSARWSDIRTDIMSGSG